MPKLSFFERGFIFILPKDIKILHIICIYIGLFSLYRDENEGFFGAITHFCKKKFLFFEEILNFLLTFALFLIIIYGVKVFAKCV